MRGNYVLCGALLSVSVLSGLMACSASSDREKFLEDQADGSTSTSSSSGNPNDPPPFNPGDGEGGAPDNVIPPGPWNYEVPGNNIDDDGDGQVDEVDECDGDLAQDGDAEAFARALGICQKAEGESWGLIEAKIVRGHNSNTNAQFGQYRIAPNFGTNINAREGQNLGILSTGYAWEYNLANGQTGGSFRGTSRTWSSSDSIPPALMPANCGVTFGVTAPARVNDTVNVKLRIRVPRNAKGLNFDFNFYSGEWPEYVGSAFNDAFAAYLESEESNGGAANVSFDSQGNPVNVNNGFFERCAVGSGSCNVNASTCSNVDELDGTAFSTRNGVCRTGNATTTAGGATGWLSTQAPVKPEEEITVNFLIWNACDNQYDSVVLLDNFRWQEGDAVGETTRPN